MKQIKLFLLLALLAVSTRLPVPAQINGDPMPFIKPQFFANNGQPAAGYKLCTYAAGTNNPIRTYTTSALSIPNPNPLILDSAGRASIFWPNVAIKTSLITEKSTTTDCLTGTMVTVWTVDNVKSPKAWITDLAAAAGAGLVGYSQTVDYPAGTVGARLERVINIADAPYSAICDGGSTDNTSKIQAALNTGKSIFVPGCSSYYGVTSRLSLTAVGQSVYGVGAKSFILSIGTNANATIFYVPNIGKNQFRNLKLTPGTTVTGQTDGFGIHLYQSDGGLIDGVEVTGHRRGAFVMENSNNTVVSNFYVHDSVVGAITLPTVLQPTSGNDVYIWGSGINNDIGPGVIKNGAGFGCVMQTANNTDVQRNNRCHNLTIDGEGAYCFMAYRLGNGDVIEKGQFTGIGCKNITGYILSAGSSNDFGMGGYFAGAEHFLVSDITVDGFNLNPSQSNQNCSGAIDVTGASDITVSNVKAYNPGVGTYGFCSILATANTVTGGTQHWTNITLDDYNAHVSDCMYTYDVPVKIMSGFHCYRSAVAGTAIEDQQNNNDQVLLSSWDHLDIDGWQAGLVQSTPGGGTIKKTIVSNSYVKNNTSVGVKSTGVETNLHDNFVDAAAGGTGLSWTSAVTSGFVTHNNITGAGGGSTCIDNAVPMVLLDQNTVATCTTLYTTGSNEAVLTAATATPSVAGNLRWATKTDTTTITNFNNATQSQVFTLRAQANFRLTNSASLILAGAANFDMQTEDSWTGRFDGAVWREISRSVNH